MRWLAPPDRREISLLIFSLTIFTLSYNIEGSIRLLGLDPFSVSSRLGLGRSKVIGQDGRRPPGWRDDLETKIFGDWGWDERSVAGDGEERRQAKGVGEHGAQWIDRRELGDVSQFGKTKVNEAFLRWGDEVPRTKLLKHVPGEFFQCTRLTGQLTAVRKDTPFSIMSFFSIGRSTLSRTTPSTFLQALLL